MMPGIKTDYMRILRYYLETDGSVQETARVLNYHRNTINHRMQNIRQILGKEKIFRPRQSRAAPGHSCRRNRGIVLTAQNSKKNEGFSVLVKGFSVVILETTEQQKEELCDEWKRNH